MSPVIAGVIGIILLLLLLLASMPIAWALGLSGFLGLLLLLTSGAALDSLFQLPWGYMASYHLSVIPLFIFMGCLAFEGGIGRDAYSVAYKWFGRLPGGLAVATAAAAAMFAAVTGSSPAAAATIGKVAIPEMQKFKYSDKLSCGAVAACGTLGVLIPPSIILVAYGVVTEQSIGHLLLAGFIPGIVSAIIYGIMIVTRVKLNPSIAPPAPGVSWGERLVGMSQLWPIFLLFVTVIGGIYLGVFTPTEAASAGSLMALVLLMFRTKQRGKAFWAALRETASLTGMIFAILVGVAIFSLFLTLSTIPGSFAEFLVNLPLPRMVVLSLIMLMYIPLGMFINPLGMIFITMPVIFPAVIDLGFDGIWFGIIITKLIEIALITPPVGLNVFVVRGIAPPHVRLEDIFKGIAWFFVMDVITLAILVAFPQISLWLPSTMG